jgi:hypothetical protein
MATPLHSLDAFSVSGELTGENIQKTCRLRAVKDSQNAVCDIRRRPTRPNQFEVVSASRLRLSGNVQTCRRIRHAYPHKNGTILRHRRFEGTLPSNSANSLAEETTGKAAVRMVNLSNSQDNCAQDGTQDHRIQRALKLGETSCSNNVFIDQHNSTNTSSPSTVTANVCWQIVGVRQCVPVLTSYCQPCHGQVTTPLVIVPLASGPPA